MGITEWNKQESKDHAFINKCFKNSVKDTRGSANAGSDHHLMCTTVKLRLGKQRKEKKFERVRYDMEKLTDTKTARTFNIAVRNRFKLLENEELEEEQK